MKSILADFRRSKIAVLTILEALNIDFRINFTLENFKTPKSSKFNATQMVKMAVIETSK